MPPSDSDDDAIDDLDFDVDQDDDAEGDADADDEPLDAQPDDATEADDESVSEDSEDEDDEDDDTDEPDIENDVDDLTQAMEVDAKAVPSDHGSSPATKSPSPSASSSSTSKSKSPQAPSRPRSLSPAHLRRNALKYIPTPSTLPRSYTVEAICALPHPVPTHALTSSVCMTRLLTGSDDGIIRDYDIFAAVNGKTFLSAPQRHHAGVVEGLMKAGQVRCWWENPAPMRPPALGIQAEDEPTLAPVYSMAMHSDALWALAGSDVGNINLYTVRHEPGRLCHVMDGHRGPVSALSMDYDEKGFFSSGWDGEAIQWDLNNGQIVRRFTAHGAQLAGIAVRPASSSYLDSSPPVVHRATGQPPVSETQQAPQTNSFRTQADSQDTMAISTPTPDPSGLVMNVDSSLTPTSTLETQQSTEIAIAPQPLLQSPPQDSDVKSEASYDPLFDDDPDEGDNAVTNDGSQVPVPTTTNDTPTASSTPTTQLGLPGTQEFQLAMPTGVPPLPPQVAVQPSRPQQQQPAQSGPRSTLGSIPPPKNAPPLLDPAAFATYSKDLLMTASIDGQVILWDRRVHSPGRGVGRLWMNEKTPPWCLSACWSADGAQMYAGRRNGTVDVWDVRQLGRSGLSNTPRLLKTLRNPLSSGVVSCVVAFPDCRHIACASVDNLRLWNVAEANEPDAFGKTKSGVPFKIIPGHHGGYISQMLVDPGARFLVSSSSNRGWHGDSTRTVFVHDIK